MTRSSSLERLGRCVSGNRDGGVIACIFCCGVLRAKYTKGEMRIQQDSHASGALVSSEDGRKELRGGTGGSWP
jgi:hypothetical protein